MAKNRRSAIKNDELIEACKRHILSPGIDAVVHEPYIPYIPDDWNGMLVLAESQNLSKSSSKYVKELECMAQIEKFHRLTSPRLTSSASLGVQPWDDCSLKLAVESAFRTKAENTAVSNAVFWSQVDESGNNKNPSEDLIRHSVMLWVDLLPLIRPNHIVTCGNIAHRVIKTAKQETLGSWDHTQLRLPSRTAMSRISGMFPEEDLLSRYPEVKKVVQERPEWLEGGYRHNKIFFACHAVSVVAAEKRAKGNGDYQEARIG